MVSGMGGITLQAVEFALDGLSMRHNAIASNIANSNAIGYRPIKVDFESKLVELLDSQKNSDNSTPDFSSVTPLISLGSPVNAESSPAMFETNMVLLNQNVVQYQALIKGLAVYQSSISEAIKEGKR